MDLLIGILWLMIFVWAFAEIVQSRVCAVYVMFLPPLPGLYVSRMRGSGAS